MRWRLTDAQRELVGRAQQRFVAAGLAFHAPVERKVFRHWEDEDLGIGPIGEEIACGGDLRGAQIVVRASHDGDVKIQLYPYRRTGDPSSWFHVRLTRETSRALTDAGFSPYNPREARVRTREAVDRAVDTVLAAAGDRLTARAFPPGTAWPWMDFVDMILLADTIEAQWVERGHPMFRTRVNDQVHTVQCNAGAPELALVPLIPTLRLEPW